MRTFPPVPAVPAVAVVATSVALCFALLSVGCTGDPNDPETWAKQLKNLRTQKEALDHLAVTTPGGPLPSGSSMTIWVAAGCSRMSISERYCRAGSSVTATAMDITRATVRSSRSL